MFPSVFIRLCQFHVVQAISRWDADDGKRESVPKIGVKLKVDILVLFRSLQRCRSWGDWPKYKSQFEDALYALIMGPDGDDTDRDDEEDGKHEDDEEDGADTDSDLPPAVKHEPATKAKDKIPLRANDDLRLRQYNTILQYFNKNWFTERWICKLDFLYYSVQPDIYRGLAHFTDIGMPPAQTREGTWNVNNWIESAFRVFDTVFLDNRRNKR